jgi:nitroreductase
MTFLDLVRKRYSLRKFQDKKIEKEKMLEVLEAARLAPSAANCQPWHFIVVQDKATLEKVYPLYQRDWIKSAPALIVICGDHDLSWRRTDGKDHCDIDIAIAIDHMTLAAAELGLGTCWICMFDAEKCHELFELPANIEPIALLPIGYPKESVTKTKNRKAFEEIVHWESFS